MKKLSAFIGLLFAANFSSAQLSVKPIDSDTDSYVYVQGSVLFVNQGVNLQKNADASLTEASIYLRKEGQLIQGHTERAVNSGNGLLSVFQEGTANAYDYNYWAAPVGTGPSGNGFFGIGMLYSPLSPTHSLKAEPTTDLEGSSKPLKVSSIWIHTYSGKEYSSWYSIQDRTEIPAAYGFIMKGVNGTDPTIVEGTPNNSGNSQRYDFRGLPNNGPINIPVAPETFVLVGNPYPSALDLSLFLLENSGTGNFSSECLGTISRSNRITGIAYFWDSIENGTSHYLEDYIGGYGAFSPVDPCTAGIYERPLFKSYGNIEAPPDLYGKHYERRYLPIAQGFMVEGTTDSELEFKNSQRIFKKEGQDSDFKRVTKESNRDLRAIPKIRLEITFNDAYTRSLSLGFWPSATSGTDTGMDAKSFDVAPTDMGWLHKEEAYVIDVRPFRPTEEIPFYLKVENTQAQIKLKVVEMENFNSKELFVYDSDTQIYHPLKSNDFNITLDPGSFHNRFKLRFQDSRETVPVPEMDDTELSVFQNDVLNQFEIWNPNLLSIRSISFFDLSGRQVFNDANSSSEFLSISTDRFAESVYIVKIVMEDHREVRKLIRIRNSN